MHLFIKYCDYERRVRMLIDLHCHTKKIKQGDASTRNVKVDKFVEKVLQANVKIVAITNHNHFDYEQYCEFREATNAFCEIWPGVELDIKGKNKRGHLVVIANPINAEYFSEVVSEMIGDENPDLCLFDLKTVYEKLDKCDVIYIPHFHKEPKLCESDIEELNSLLKDKNRLFKETSDYRSLGVYANYDYSVIIGSDVQNWDEYEKSTFADLRLSVSGFKQFCLLAKKDKVFINTLLNNKHAEELLVSPYENVNLKLKIYTDINIIFGQKGTGKSEILKSLKECYAQRSISCNSYAGSEKEEDFSKLLKTDDLYRDVKELQAENCTNEFEFLQKWEDKLPIQLKKYMDWHETKDNNGNKRRMRITDSAALSFKDTKEYESIDRDFKCLVKNIVNNIKEIDLDKYIPNEKEELMKILSLLKNNIYEKLVSEWREIEATKLTNTSLHIIKKIADKCSDTVSKPSTTGFEEFAMNRIKLKENMDKIYKNLGAKEKNTLTLIGEIEDKGKIYIQSKYRMLCKDSKKEEFKVRINKLKELRRNLDDIHNNYYKYDVTEIINKANNLAYEENVKNIDCFLGISKIVVTKENEKYSPSNGERGILLLQKLLKEDSDVYILDEPELGMGNSYINNTIVPQLVDLAKQRKTIIVATHNANIAVRTLPYMSIYRVHKNGEYYTYIGNPFSDELFNLENENEVKNWTKESMHTLEGGKNAFYERKDIYESGNSIN